MKDFSDCLSLNFFFYVLLVFFMCSYAKKDDLFDGIFFKSLNLDITEGERRK